MPKPRRGLTMGSLFATLGLAQTSMHAHELGLEIAQKNIANANTPGYSRQRLNLVPADAFHFGLAGNGVLAASIDTFRNRFIDFRINGELQSQGEYQAAFAALQQVEFMFNENSGQGLQQAMSKFFNSFSALANAPEDLGLRQDVLARGSELGARFRLMYDVVNQMRTDQDKILAGTIEEINSISSVLSKLNGEIVSATGTHSQEEHTLRDQRQQLLDRLASLVDINPLEDTTGSVTVTTKQGVLLVAGNTSYVLKTAPPAA